MELIVRLGHILNPILVLITLSVEDSLRRDLHLESKRTNTLGVGCLGGTRKELLSDITAWFDDGSAPNILWLCGAPGTGKTTILWSLIEGLKRRQRCAGFFFFRHEEKDTPSLLWRTLAYEMAKFHPAIETKIRDAVATGKNGDLDLNDVEITFEKLVRDPLKATEKLLSDHSPVLLIDALEECNQNTNWETLLRTLLQWSSLPRHFKLVIASRPQSDISKAFEGKDIKRVDFRTGGDVDSNTRQDVVTYFYHHLRRQENSVPVSLSSIIELADHSKGFFKWAAAAVESIHAAEDKKKQLTAIIKGGTAIKLDPFDKYLEEVLKMVFGAKSSETLERNSPDASKGNSPDTPKGSSLNAFEGHTPDVFQEALGVIVHSRQPLTMTDLDHFLQDHFKSTSGVSIEYVCDRLLPIVSIDSDEGKIKIRHSAFKDYLVDSNRRTLFDNAFHGNAHMNMTIRCLKIMQEKLKFNICELKSSHRMNNQIEDKDSLVKKYIPSYLAYACQYWADHLRGVTALADKKREGEIVILLLNFLDSNLLHWLEVLSLLSKSDVATKSLLVAAEWLEVSSVVVIKRGRGFFGRTRTTAKELSSLAADASRFSFTFADVISASAPHIYLSALPFAPPSSLVSKRYREQFLRTIKVLNEEGVKWPAMRFSISAGISVYGISIHPDGRKVAAAMRASVAKVYSMTTGETLITLSGHRRSARAIAYSPSGKRIATGAL